MSARKPKLHEAVRALAVENARTRWELSRRNLEVVESMALTVERVLAINVAWFPGVNVAAVLIDGDAVVQLRREMARVLELALKLRFPTDAERAWAAKR